jgi:glycosyltransferase involved in cell wall biosynthesis
VKPWLAVPIYDHGDTIAEVVRALEPLGLPCLVVDDGSGDATQRELGMLTRLHPWLRVERHAVNRGRGEALKTAYRVAAAGGASHVVQLDADGQHDPRDVPRFLEAAQQRPEALVLGQPVFDGSAPWIRRQGRKLSQLIVWVETASLAVADPLCGFRCIPLAPTLRILDGFRLGSRMDFDPELIVRLVRAGVPVVNVPTAVRYPEGGLSHFDFVADNVRLAKAYGRLALGGLGRASASRADGTRSP